MNQNFKDIKLKQVFIIRDHFQYGKVKNPTYVAQRTLTFSSFASLHKGIVLVLVGNFFYPKMEF